MRPSARSQVDLPLALNLPYSVTSQWRLVRVQVATEPSSSVGRIRDCSLPVFLSITVEEQQNLVQLCAGGIAELTALQKKYLEEAE